MTAALLAAVALGAAIALHASTEVLAARSRARHRAFLLDLDARQSTRARSLTARVEALSGRVDDLTRPRSGGSGAA